MFNDLHVFLLCFVEVDIKPTNHHRGLQHNFIYHHKDCGGEGVGGCGAGGGVGGCGAGDEVGVERQLRSILLFGHYDSQITNFYMSLIINGVIFPIK